MSNITPHTGMSSLIEQVFETFNISVKYWLSPSIFQLVKIQRNHLSYAIFEEALTAQQKMISLNYQALRKSEV